MIHLIITFIPQPSFVRSITDSARASLFWQTKGKHRKYLIKSQNRSAARHRSCRRLWLLIISSSRIHSTSAVKNTRRTFNIGTTFSLLGMVYQCSDKTKAISFQQSDEDIFRIIESACRIVRYTESFDWCI